MARKNLAGRTDIDGGVLRQRRDFYAIAIGLLLFQLAQGSVEHTNTLGGMLPLKFENPCWFLWAAWVGFFYFMLRYQLMAPKGPWRMWLDEAKLQAADASRIRKMAAGTVIRAGDDAETDRQRREIMEAAGPIPRINGFGPQIQLVTRNLYRDKFYSPQFPGKHATSYLQINDGLLTGLQRLELNLAVCVGLLVSTWREHSFTDYCMPYVFAGITLLTAVFRWIAGDTHFCFPWM